VFHPRRAFARSVLTLLVVGNDVPDAEVFGEDSGKVLVVGWGGTYGSIHSAVKRCQADGIAVSQAHLRWINPFPKNLGEVLGRFEHVLVPELNTGQLRLLLRDRFLVDAHGLNKVQGQPFKTHEIRDRIRELYEA